MAEMEYKGLLRLGRFRSGMAEVECRGSLRWGSVGKGRIGEARLGKNCLE